MLEIGSNSSCKISDIDFIAALDMAYAPQKALPFFTTPDDVNMTLGFVDGSIMGYRNFVNK